MVPFYIFRPSCCAMSASESLIAPTNSLASLTGDTFDKIAEDIVTAKNKILSQNPEMELQTLVRQREKTEKLPPKEGTTDAERPENRINKQLIRIRARLQSPEGPQAPEVALAVVFSAAGPV